MQFILKQEKPTSQQYYEKLFRNSDLAWEVIYTLPGRVRIDAKLRIFYINYCIIYLNKISLLKFNNNI